MNDGLALYIEVILAWRDTFQYVLMLSLPLAFIINDKLPGKMPTCRHFSINSLLSQSWKTNSTAKF